MPRKRSVPSPRAAGGLAVHDGTAFVGTVVERGDRHFALDADGKLIGVFKDRIAAMRAIPAVRS